MNWGLLKEVMKDIPDSATLMSDSGWECDPTDMDGVWYDEVHNVVYFTQGGEYDCYGTECRWGIPRHYKEVYRKE